MNKYYTQSIRQQNFLSEYGIEPRYYIGKTAVYNYTPQLTQLLDSYEIKYHILRSKY